jgi:hypothetical protein
MSTPHPDFDRLQDLLADRALFGLSETENRELEKLLTAMPDVDPDEFERIAAAAQLANLDEQNELPAELSRKILAQVREVAARNQKNSATIGLQTISRREMFAWFATAAAVLVAAFFASTLAGQQVAQLSPAELKAELTRTKDGVTQVAWAAGPDEAGKGATGEVLWSNKRQKGVMSFRGLPSNDPTKSQYQLWIFDTAQDEMYPVDGGVFDIPSGAEEVLIPIDAKLPVVDPTLFAITIEKPGGVVVSSRERLPLLAKVGE